MKLEFSKKTIPEILAEFDDKKTFDWQNDIFEFLKRFQEQSNEINFHYTQKESVLTSVYKYKFVYDAFESLNDKLDLKKGDTALMSFSVLSNEGEISLIQAIVGGFDLYCNEFSDEIRIPFTGEDQREIGYAIDYSFVTKKQVANSFSQINRIRKLAIEADNLDSDLKIQLRDQDKTDVYQVFTSNGLPVAVKNIENDYYEVVDKIDVSVDEKDNLILSSPFEAESLNTQRQVVLSDLKKEFRWLSGNEFRLGANREIVNLNAIENKLKPFINFNFVVLDFPEKVSKIDVITLVIESRFAAEIDIPEAELESYEVPQQIFYIGEFPQSHDKSEIRSDLKRLLKESNK